MRALVVEDEARIASFLEYGLRAEGFAVEVVDNGLDGLSRATSGHFDVVILDLMLPRMTGEEVLRRLRGQGFTTPVIVLTAKDAVLDRVQNLNAGADDYLVKPFSFAELLDRRGDPHVRHGAHPRSVAPRSAAPAGVARRR